MADDSTSSALRQAQGLRQARGRQAHCEAGLVSTIRTEIGLPSLRATRRAQPQDSSGEARNPVLRCDLILQPVMREHWKCAEFSGKDSPHEEMLWQIQIFLRP